MPPPATVAAAARPSPHSALDALREAGIPARYSRFSALDRFFRSAPAPLLSVSVSCGVIELAKIFPGLRYPGIDGADAALSDGGQDIYFSCDAEEPKNETFDILRLLYDPFRDSFYDPRGIYPLLRAEAVKPETRFSQEADSGRALADAAILVSRYAYRLENPGSLSLPKRMDAFFPPESQRALLSYILSGNSASRGLSLLMESGFTGALWPELAALRSVSHSKEYHPEGDVWEHTLETFRYRKDAGLTVALALLLHDAGKPAAESQDGRRFDKHAEIGSLAAEKFLRRLEFPAALSSDVVFLVRNHMLPGLLKTLPTYRVEPVMSSPLFPLLLEVYRCDLSSTFRGPDGYYEACKVYRAFLKHRKNPYRGSDGKRLKVYV